MGDAGATLDQQKADSLLAGYQAMAKDEAREAEDESWSEALIANGVE